MANTELSRVFWSLLIAVILAGAAISLLAAIVSNNPANL